jgi:hypothetical protein
VVVVSDKKSTELVLAEEEGFVVRLRALLHDANFPFFCTLSDLCLAFQVS